MDVVRLEPIIETRISRFPFENSLKEFPWKARYASLKEAHREELYAIMLGDEPVGAMFVKLGSTPELVFFEVMRHYRGKGIGQAALDILFERLKEMRCVNLIVQTGRPEIYTKMGYEFKKIDQGHIKVDIYEPRLEALVNAEARSVFIYSERYLIHDFPNHPENGSRVGNTINRIHKENLLNGANFVAPRLATEEEICLVHTKEMMENVRRCAEEGRNVAKDTPTGPDSYNLARLSLGGALMAGDLVEKGRHIFVFCRPPGHHAGSDRSSGFCFFNNMAALAVSLHKKGYSPMIIDWDVHHGNGTQEILYEMPIMYVSLHQRYLYPNTGSEDETGEGKGKGYTRNIPLGIGVRDDQYLEVFRETYDIAREMKPDILLISAGQDGHHLDPLSGMRLSSGAYYEMGRMVGEIAAEHCEGRLILLLEGGYHLEANAEALTLAIKGIQTSASDN